MTAVNTTRRALVLGGPVLAGLSAAGCCTIPPTPQISGACAHTNAFLAGPEVRDAWSKKERFFDAHTHFFNAQDVPVAGFLKKSVAHSIPSERLRKLVIALAPIAEALANLAPTPKVEYEELCKADGRALKSLKAQSDELDRAVDSRRNDTAKELYQRILRDSPEIPQLFNEATSAAKSRNENAFRGQTANFSQQFVEEALRDGGGERDANNKFVPSDTKNKSAEEAEAASLKNALQFVGFMLSPRHHNLRTYIRKYAEHSPDLPLSGCFAAMVDFNYWLDCPAKASHMQDQVLLHEQLALLSGGFMLPLVAYNPWVDIQENDASINLVKRAIESHGCVGVKMYPPMGFYPYGNFANPLTSKEPRPADLALLDKKLLALYELCDNLGVPVMAHANESNGRDHEHDTLAGAKGWKALRDHVPQSLKKLHVNAGHFGGDSVKTTGDWTDDFVRLMSERGALRVYGDLGYWEKLLSSDSVKVNLKALLTTKLEAGGIAADRVMYGSDWLMLSQVPGWELYGGQMARVLQEIAPSKDAFFKVMGSNALECFGLSPSSGSNALSRLKLYYASNGLLTGPGWLS